MPLKGEARRRRAGRMLFETRGKQTVQQKGPKGDCAVARSFFCVFVFVFDFLFISIFAGSATSVSYVEVEI
jgi:hypothetical protein